MTTIPTMDNESTATTIARIGQFCEWTGVLPPVLTYDEADGQILLTEDFVRWMTGNGASIDWIVLGDVRGLAVRWRDEKLKERDFQQSANTLDEPERRMLLAALKAVASSEVPVDDAMTAWTAACEEHRASKQEVHQSKIIG